MTIDQDMRAGAIALVGSGEYLAAMDETDAYLLGTLGKPGDTRVALMPTASGLEANGPAHWNSLGLQHFHGLGVQDVRATKIVDRASAQDERQLELLWDANFFYFSGGNPQHTVDSLRGTAAWQIITGAHIRGAVLAGCSAGAMMLGGYTLGLRQLMAGGKPQLVEALGVVPNLMVFPHFDRMSGFVSDKMFRDILALLPPGHVALGIDENTALVRVQLAQGEQPARWRVMGSQTVSVFTHDADVRVLRVGDELGL